MKRSYSATIVAVLIAGSLVAMIWRSKSEQSAEPSSTVSCSDGWRITGYFTPIESEFDSKKTTEVDVAGVGKLSFNSDFVNVVFDEEKGFGEGWGKTRFGWYLGNYDNVWHQSDKPLDAHNSPLKPNSIAVDNKVIPNDSIVTIPGLPDGYGAEKFIANDEGVTVHGKHIDLYTGEGKEPEHEMDRVTFEDDGDLQRVCFESPAASK